MNEFIPLNRPLYRALVRRFGQQNVKVVSRGAPIVWRLAQDSAGDRPRRKILRPGEEYATSCPFCGDRKKRLYINHRWGVFDPETGTRNLWLAQCFNEQCLADYSRQVQLYEMVFGRGGAGRIVIETPPSAAAAELVPAALPDNIQRLEALPEDHPAIRYLMYRGFDPRRLSRDWGVCYCPADPRPFVRQRLIIPVRWGEVVYGWQARFVGDFVEGRPLKDAGIPKYWTMPRTPKALLGYNTDVAVRHQTIVIVEGPTDAWRVGRQALALLGKSISDMFVAHLAKCIRRCWREEAIIAVILDADASPDAVCRRLVDGLAFELRRRVFPVYLEDGFDPGSLPRRSLRERIRREAAARGLEARFDRLAVKEDVQLPLPEAALSWVGG